MPGVNPSVVDPNYDYQSYVWFLLPSINETVFSLVCYSIREEDGNTIVEFRVVDGFQRGATGHVSIDAVGLCQMDIIYATLSFVAAQLRCEHYGLVNT